MYIPSLKCFESQLFQIVVETHQINQFSFFANAVQNRIITGNSSSNQFWYECNGYRMLGKSDARTDAQTSTIPMTPSDFVNRAHFY